MAGLRKIPDVYMEEISILVSQGHSARWILDNFLKPKGIICTHSTVYTFINLLKKTRQEAAQAVIANEAAIFVVKDLQTLETVIEGLKIRLFKSFDDVKLVKVYSGELFKYLKFRMELSGINNEQDKKEEQELKDLLFAKFGLTD